MKMRWFAALLVVLASCYAGDWLSYRGDPQGTGWQRHGKALTVANVKNLKLLWKRQLDDRSLSSPVIIGPTITHRGVRELVFVAGAGDNLYAVDADLGTLFWKRHFDVGAKRQCFSGMPPTPVIEPDPDEDLSGDAVADDEDDDEAGPMRPLYAVDSDGKLHTIRVSDGTDSNTPVNFMPSNASYSGLNFWSGTVYAATYGGCGASDGLWSLDVGKAGAKRFFVPGKGGRGVVMGKTGAVDGDVALRYKGREFLVESDGPLHLLDAGNFSMAAEYRKPYTRYGVATYQDSAGARWIYAATEKNVMGFKITGPSGGPRIELAWTYDGPNASRPAVTNGIVFVVIGPGVADSSSTTLIALDAATGKEIYSSGSVTYAYAPHPAIANGHVCFAGSGNTLYCFGIPLER